MGGYLVTIADNREQGFVAGIITDNRPVWLGASDSTVEGDWQWADGTPWNYSNWYSGGVVIANGAAEAETGNTLAGDASARLRQIMGTADSAAAAVAKVAENAAQIEENARSVASVFDELAAVIEENTAATEEMTAGATQTTRAVEAIANAANGSAGAVAEISASLEELSASSEQVSTSANALAEMTRILRERVASFKL
jgi:methyl-accepting chemotaxis protein